MKNALEKNAIIDGRYSVLSVINNTLKGQIEYRCVDLKKDMQVVVKEFYPEYAMRNEKGELVYDHMGEIDKRAFREKYQTAMKFRTLPTVIKVLDIFEANKSCYVVMEDFEGTSLDKLVANDTAFTYIAVKKALINLLKTNESLMKFGLCQADFSPENIMITYDGYIKICEFNPEPSDVAERSAVKSLSSLAYYMVNGFKYTGKKDKTSVKGNLQLVNKYSAYVFRNPQDVTIAEFLKVVNGDFEFYSNNSNDSNDIFVVKNKKSVKVILISVAAFILVVGAVLGFVISNNMAKAFDSSIIVEYSLDGGENFTELVFSADETKTDFNANMSEKIFDKGMLGDAEQVAFRISKKNEDAKVTLKCDDAEIQGNVGKNENNGVYTEYVVDIADKDLCKITIESKGSVFISTNKTTYTITCTKEAFAKLDVLTVKVDDADLIAYDKTQTEYTDIEVETGKKVAVGYSAPDTHTVKVTFGNTETKDNPVIINVNDEATWTVTLKVTADGYKENIYTVKIKGVKPQDAQKNHSNMKSSNKTDSSSGSVNNGGSSGSVNNGGSSGSVNNGGSSGSVNNGGSSGGVNNGGSSGGVNNGGSNGMGVDVLTNFMKNN